MTSNTASTPAPRGFFRFSLRMLLVAMLVLGFGLGWYGKEWTRLREQRAIAARFEARNAYVDYDPKLPPPNQKSSATLPLKTRAAHALFGDDAFAYVNVVWLKETNREDLELFPKLPKLRTLFLTAPPEDGFELIARNRQLRALTLRNCKLSRDQYSQLQKLSHLTELGFDGKVVDDSSLEGLPALQQIEELVFKGTPNVTSKSALQIAKLPHLRFLFFESAGGVGDDAIPHLKALQNLHTLGLDGTTTTSASLVHIREMKQLRSLWLGYSQISDAGFEHLTELPLTELSVSGTVIGSQSLSQIAKIRSLEKLELGGRSSPLTDVDLVPLAELRKLKNLSLSSPAVTSSALSHLKSLRNLRELYLNSKLITRQAAAQLQTQLPQCMIYGQDAAGSYELPAIAP